MSINFIHLSYLMNDGFYLENIIKESIKDSGFYISSFSDSQKENFKNKVATIDLAKLFFERTGTTLSEETKNEFLTNHLDTSIQVSLKDSINALTNEVENNSLGIEKELNIKSGIFKNIFSKKEDTKDLDKDFYNLSIFNSSIRKYLSNKENIDEILSLHSNIVFPTNNYSKVLNIVSSKEYLNLYDNFINEDSKESFYSEVEKLFI